MVAVNLKPGLHSVFQDNLSSTVRLRLKQSRHNKTKQHQVKIFQTKFGVKCQILPQCLKYCVNVLMADIFLQFCTTQILQLISLTVFKIDIDLMYVSVFGFFTDVD